MTIAKISIWLNKESNKLETSFLDMKNKEVTAKEWFNAYKVGGQGKKVTETEDGGVYLEIYLFGERNGKNRMV